MSFRRYIALGDSMSIDLYAALDLGETDVAVALERDPSVGRVAPLGAASLLFRNDETHWPEEIGRDLSSQYPGITFQKLAVSGATIGDVFGEQLSQIDPTDDRTLVTLTLGGEDLFSAFSARPKRALLDRIVTDLIEAYDLLLESIRTTLPNSLILLTTACDPSDRIGRIPGILEDVGKLPLSAMDRLNVHLREAAAQEKGIALADAYLAFLGHGASDDEPQRWYWRRAPLELNARGAHELRLVWIEALRRAEGEWE
jgi:lysophospholipase L1-like esterase